MDLHALREAVIADRQAGRRPFCVVGSAGTVNTGAVDPLDELADFCAEQGLWLHVDGAYGAFGILDPNVSHLYTGLERADSVALDPHKWLATPIECSCAIVRQGNLLRETFSLVPPYLRTEPDKGIGGLPWFAEYGFQQTRRFNALKLLWVIQQAGRTGLVAHVTRHNTLAQYMASLIDDVPDLELMAPVELSIVCFRYVPDSLRGDEEQLDALNKKIMEEVQVRGKAFVNGTILHGRFVLRSCALHYALTEDDVVAIDRGSVPRRCAVPGVIKPDRPERGLCMCSETDHSLSASSAIGNQGIRTLLYGVIETETRWLLLRVLNVGNRVFPHSCSTCPRE